MGPHSLGKVNLDDSAVADAVTEALVSDVEPERLDSYAFALGILPAFRLVRSLFSQNEADTCLKLMLLYELSRAAGRHSLERIRQLVGYLDPERVESLVRSLYQGEWLELRASDNTYTLHPEGLNLLGVLHSANLGSLTPDNALARAAQNAEFSATLLGSQGKSTSFLLEQLLVLLEGQAESARGALQHGRAYQMIEWSRRQHGQQLDIIRRVLVRLQEVLPESSHEFGRVVRLHEAMQEIVRLHTGINTRLREWNLERLHSSAAGYSIAALTEALLGTPDAVLLEVVERRGLTMPVLPPSLTTEELRARFHGARRRLPQQEDPFNYAPPPAPAAQPLALADRGPSAELRARLTELLAGRGPADPPLELDDWVAAPAFSAAIFEVATLAQLEGMPVLPIPLDDGRCAEVDLVTDLAADVPPGELLAYLTMKGALRRLPAGHFARVRIRIAGEGVVAHG